MAHCSLFKVVYRLKLAATMHIPGNIRALSFIKCDLERSCMCVCVFRFSSHVCLPLPFGSPKQCRVFNVCEVNGERLLPAPNNRIDKQGARPSLHCKKQASSHWFVGSQQAAVALSGRFPPGSCFSSSLVSQRLCPGGF